MLEIADRTTGLLVQRDDAVSHGVLTAHPLVLERARGAEVWDVDGKRYLDFVGGIGVMNVGHNHPRVVEAVQAQLGKISHAAFQVAAYPPYLMLARRLNALVGDGYKSILLTTGAEAVENAVKIARAHTNRSALVAFRGGFHGRTLLGMTLTGMSVPYQQNFGPFAPSVFHVPYPYAYRNVSVEDALYGLDELFATEVTPDQVAAILIEPVQGDGGFLPAPAAFLRALREITQRHGIVLILDEIQTGFGRTGTMFGFQQSAIEPDLVTVAKSLAGGLPLSAVIGRTEMMDAPQPGGLGGTYGGNAVACAAALGVLDAFQQDGLLEQGRAMGTALEAGLRRMQRRFPAAIGEVRGVGPMLAIEMVSADGKSDAALTQRVIDEARGGGLLVIKCGIQRNVIRFLAPLVTTRAQVDEALEILGWALECACAGQTVRTAPQGEP